MPKWKSALWLAIPQDNRASVPQMYQRYAATAGARESNEQQTESNDATVQRLQDQQETMRLYHALLVTAVALLASNVSASSTDCAMTPIETTSGSAPKDSFDGFDSSNDSPIQQGSTTSSDVGSSQEVSSASGSSPKDSFDGFDSSNDSPIQQGSAPGSDVGSSQEVSSASGSAPKDSFDGFDSSNDSPIQQTSSDQLQWPHSRLP
ncbi:hypothetical protein PPTG_08669 [Phytophthora nicotianae INRA-310]|uniref:Uncharacterized protein n=1 Tax=Phytophthora nicotianae (strain INRA-310) TaxID=761204 RepID=W2QLI9_PHYN3|nr:hypothetical protein PPTG_08669 [Phytophthora nicotianae INRA-310]ETN14013.1 hypothetical protein PPTG_08669 [Phytophthora nicotianae INRA-310]